MNALESELVYAFGDTLPETGRCMQVAPGVYWLRMGLPFALNHINLWLLEEEAGWTIVDCGIANEDTRAAWEVIFAHELRGLPILRVIATHCHPDHIGLAEWLCTRWQVPFYITLGEYGFARMLAAGLPGTDGAAMINFFRSHGLAQDKLAQLEGRKNHYQTLVPTVPAHFIRLEEATPLQIGQQTWRIITGSGHSPEHAALYCESLGVMISGDMVLPRISTNTSVFAVEPEADAVGNFLQSLKKFLPLPADTLILPSHGKPFRGLHARIVQLTTHHAERLAEVLAVCDTAKSAADIVPIMFTRALDMHQMTFAMGEALAHLHRLWYEGKLLRMVDEHALTTFVRAPTA